MAIDTPQKRKSALGFHSTCPVPSATVDASERKHMAWIYSGIASGPPTPVTSTGGTVTNIIRACSSASGGTID